jgi:CxxC-x17-CxxC domain-containing protein
MGNFNRDNKRSGGGFNRSFGGGSKFGGRDREDGGRTTMYKATCSDCGASCELPFRPSGDRPVYCSNCFGKQDAGSRPNKFGGDRHERPRFEDKQMYDARCAKCGKDCQVPFRPRDGKPIYCSNCFDKGGSGSASGGNDLGKVIDQIKVSGSKLDRLLSILALNQVIEKKEKTEAKAEVKEKTKTKVVAKKVKAKKNK